MNLNLSLENSRPFHTFNYGLRNRNITNGDDSMCIMSLVVNFPGISSSGILKLVAQRFKRRVDKIARVTPLDCTLFFPCIFPRDQKGRLIVRSYSESILTMEVCRCKVLNRRDKNSCFRHRRRRGYGYLNRSYEPFALPQRD